MVAWQKSFSSNNVLSVTLNLAVTAAPGKRESNPSCLITDWRREGGVLSSLGDKGTFLPIPPLGALLISNMAGPARGRTFLLKSSKGENTFSSSQSPFQITVDMEIVC